MISSTSPLWELVREVVEINGGSTQLRTGNWASQDTHGSCHEDQNCRLHDDDGGGSFLVEALTWTQKGQLRRADER